MTAATVAPIDVDDQDAACGELCQHLSAEVQFQREEGRSLVERKAQFREIVELLTDPCTSFEKVSCTV